MPSRALTRLAECVLAAITVVLAVALAFAAGYRSADGGSAPDGARSDDVVGTVVDPDGGVREDELYAELEPPPLPTAPEQPAPVSSPR